MFRSRSAVKLSFEGTTSRTHQSFKDECNINSIMAKWQKTGLVSHLAKNPPTFGNFDQAIDFQSAQNMVLEAQATFDALSSAVRERMHHDPQEFVDFMDNPENTEEAIKLGLLPEPIPKSKIVPTDPANRAEPPAGNAPPPQPAPIAGGE